MVELHHVSIFEAFVLISVLSPVHQWDRNFNHFVSMPIPSCSLKRGHLRGDIFAFTAAVHLLTHFLRLLQYWIWLQNLSFLQLIIMIRTALLELTELLYHIKVSYFKQDAMQVVTSIWMKTDGSTTFVIYCSSFINRNSLIISLIYVVTLTKMNGWTIPCFTAINVRWHMVQPYVVVDNLRWQLF